MIQVVYAVSLALVSYVQPIYVRDAIADDRRVIEDLELRSAVSLEESDEDPNGVSVISSALDVPKNMRPKLVKRGLSQTVTNRALASSFCTELGDQIRNTSRHFSNLHSIFSGL